MTKLAETIKVAEAADDAKMDCKVIWTQFQWIRHAANSGVARLDNGDSNGIERALQDIEIAIALIRREQLKKGGA